LADKLQVRRALGGKYEISFSVAGRWVPVQRDFATEEAAQFYLDKNRADLLDRVSNREPVRPMLSGIERVGRDARGGKPATAEMFQKTFGFRGVEFGNWLSAGDRQASLNHAFDALHDLASALGLPPKALSLHGELGLGFGSRGKSRALAHYEPSRVIINLTKMNGAGSLAHEWGHALDNYFARAFGGGRERFVSEGFRGVEAREEIKRAWFDVMRAIKNGIAEDGKPADAYAVSQFLKNAQELDKFRGGKYWQTTVELFARAFESYVQDKVGKSDYLVNSTEEGSSYNPQGYPKGTERKAIATAFDKLFSTMETKETAQGTLLFRLSPIAAAARSSVADLRAELDKRFGAKGVQSLLDRGVLNIVQSVGDLPSHIQAGAARSQVDPRRIRGLYDGKAAYLIADNTQPENAVSLLLHEIGEHHGLKAMLGDADYARLLNAVRLARAPRDSNVLTAWHQVERNYQKLRPGTDEFIREVIAHVGENPSALDASWFKRMLQAVRRFLWQKGFRFIELTDDDLRGMVVASLRRVMSGKGAAPAPAGFSLKGKFGSDRTPWGDFPPVHRMQPLGAAQKHAEYTAAKAGNAEAAYHVARDLLDDQR
ncbi:MAG: LPD1 domain-containing protein, partial [Myxococcota bacterium]